MQLFVGSLSLPANGCDCRTLVQAVVRSGRAVRHVKRIIVTGDLEADGQAALSTLETALRLALENLDPRASIVLRTDAGGVSATTLIGSQSISGVRVMAYSFDNARGGAEYATLRSFSFIAEAEFLAPAGRNAILSFQESVTVIGTGGPVTRFRPALNAPPVKQLIFPSSVVRATQSGQAVGQLRYPIPPIPLWPVHELLDQRVRTLVTPDFAGQELSEFTSIWSYSFEAAVSLNLPPNVFPR